MQKKYVVRLTDAERVTLNLLLKKRRVASQKVRRAQVLLRTDADGPNWNDAEVAEAFDCRTKTVENIRERFVTEGFEITLNGKPKSRVRGKVLDGEQEAKIIAMRLGQPPKGFANWTLRLLAERVVTLEIVESVSHETLRRTLKKNQMTKRKIEYWVIPPEADAEFAASMEEVLDVYARPYDSRYPVLCMDEQPIQLLEETRQPIAGTKKHPRRVDYEYERAGTASIFMFCEPLWGWRQVSVRDRRTKVDWAREVEELLRTRYASAEKVILVSDNLNTHTKGAFYEAFDPEKARSLVRRLEFCHTPKHGSWLNIAENELSSMTRQCIKNRRFAIVEELRAETAAWHDHSNARQRGVDWQFQIDDARVKLKSVYPKLQV